MTANVMYLERKEALFLLNLLYDERNACIEGDGEDARCINEKRYELLDGLIDELVNYSADHCRTVNAQCQASKEAIRENDPSAVNKIISLECSWDRDVKK